MSGQTLTVTPLQALEEKKGWSTALSGSTLLPDAYRQAPANLLLAAEYADTLGVPRMAALTGIHVIKGKPSMSADLMLALVRRAGHRVRVSGDAQQAQATLIREDDPEYEYRAEWNLAKAERAGLLAKKGNWQHYPEAMLRARAITEVVRMGASEVLFGAVYAPEELGVEVDEAGLPVEPATEPAVEAASHVEPDLEPLVSQQVMDEIDGYAQELRLTHAQVAATARYCGHEGKDTLHDLTARVGASMAEYLRGRRDKMLAEMEAEADEEIITAELIEDGDL